MDRVHRDDIDFDDRLARSEVEEGEQYIYEWSPYNWAYQNEGYLDRVTVTVTEVHEFSGDIKMRVDGGPRLTDLGEGRPQVMGSAENTEGVPDYTDVGRGGTFYPV